MKFKPDFISNCSTSCFIVGNSTPDMVSIKMLKIILEMWKEEEKSEIIKNTSPVQKKIEEAIEFLMEHGTEHKNIFFPWGINYENFVLEVGPFRSKVKTCNNIHWWEEGLYITEWLTDTDEEYENLDDVLFLDLTDFKVKPGKELECD